MILLWILDLRHVDLVAMFVYYHLVTMLSFTETRAAEHVAMMIGYSDRTMRQWRHDLVENDGVLQEMKQGQYQRSSVLWQNEELNKEATKYVRANSTVKGNPNLTAIGFSNWINKELLPNSTLESGYPTQSVD